MASIRSVVFGANLACRPASGQFKALAHVPGIRIESMEGELTVIVDRSAKARAEAVPVSKFTHVSREQAPCAMDLALRPPPVPTRTDPECSCGQQE